MSWQVIATRELRRIENMIEINKVIKRRSNYEYDRNRKLVVILEPGDILGMREAGRRTVYRAGLGRIFIQLARWYAQDQANKKALAKKLKKSIDSNPKSARL